MHPTPAYRQAILAKHPPYGLFLDPHRGRHHWTAVNPYLLCGIVSIIGGSAALLAFITH